MSTTTYVFIENCQQFLVEKSALSGAMTDTNQTVQDKGWSGCVFALTIFDLITALGA